MTFQPRRTSAALLLVIAFAFAGCTTPFDDPSDGQETRMSMTSNSSASVAFVAASASGSAVDIVDADGLDVSADLVQASDNGTSGWIEITAPNGTAGTHEVEVQIGDDATETLVIHVEVTNEPETAQPGQVARSILSYRTSDGLVFTNDPWVANASLPHDDSYHPPQNLEPLALPVQEGQLPQALYEALLSTGVDQNVTVTADDAFGAANETQDLPRVQQVPREASEDRQLQVPRQLAEQHGIIDEDTQEGDPVELPGTSLPFVVAQLDDENVTLELDVAVGEHHTLHAQWPGASEVVELNNDVAVFRTTPPVDEGVSFTWIDTWPDATEVIEVTDDQIVLRHTPQEGAPFETQGQQGQPVQAAVSDVQDDTIIISIPNQDPLAGRTIVFDLQVVAIEDAPAPQMPGGPSSG